MTAPLKVHGVDISHHQSGTLDFALARRAGVLFVYHKATEGTHFVDDHYASRREQVKKAGLVYGAYHFARPSVGDAKAEAQFFIKVAKPTPGDLKPVLDLESTEGLSPQQLDKWAREFTDEVKKLTGFDCIVYTPFSLPSLAHLQLWVARYSNSNTAPVIPKPWDHASIRQFSNGVFGVPNKVLGLGNVDLNTFGPGASLTSITIATPVAKVGPIKQALESLSKVKYKEGSRRDRVISSVKEKLSKAKPTR